MCDKEPWCNQKVLAMERNDVYTSYNPYISKLMPNHIDYIESLTDIQKNVDEVFHTLSFCNLLEDRHLWTLELEVLLAPKSTLKKCRLCNSKKRCCALNKSDCPAFYRSCNSCKKKGHFPKSPNCTKTRKSRHSKTLSESIDQTNIHDHVVQSSLVHDEHCSLEQLRFDDNHLDMSDFSLIENTDKNMASEVIRYETEAPLFDEMTCFIDDLEECHNQEYNLFYDETKVLQLDGMDDYSDSNEELRMNSNLIIDKNVFEINCEVDAIIQLINFLRSFNFIWIALKCHSLCVIDESCFFCNIRSSFLRLRLERKKGPFLIKLNEFICHIDQYQSVLEFDFMQNMDDLVTCIEKTLQLKYW